LEHNQPQAQQRGRGPATREFAGDLKTPLAINDALKADSEKWMHHVVASP
jgi:hypothetical protein